MLERLRIRIGSLNLHNGIVHALIYIYPGPCERSCTSISGVIFVLVTKPVVQEEIFTQIMVSRIDKPQDFYLGMRLLDDRMYSPAADNVNMTKSRCR